MTFDPAAQHSLGLMQQWMLHGQDYTQGTYAAPALGLHFGWTLHAGARAAQQPVWNSSGDIGLILVGDARVMDAAGAGGTVGRPYDAADTARRVLLAYEQLGASFPDMLGGCFIGVLVDLRRGQARLFNDRYGLGRVYVHTTPGCMYFSSDPGAILRAVPQARHFDHDSVAQFFSIGCVLQNKTLYDKVELLPPSSVWTFSGRGDCQRATYFDPGRWEQQDLLSPKDFDAALSETFAALLPDYLNDPDGSAMSLTGGLDGRMIMAWSKAAPGALPCYSFGSAYRECEDVKIARRVAQACGQPFQTFEVGDAYLKGFPALADEAVRISGGAMDVTGAAELYVNRLARQVSRVRITGNYGSEIVRGGVAFRPRLMAEHLCSADFRYALARARQTYAAERDCRDLSFIAFKQVPWHHYSRLSLEQSQLTVRSPYLDDRLVKLMYRAPAESIASKLPSLKVVHDGNAALAAIRTDRGLFHSEPNTIDRMRHRWLEFTFKAEYAYDYGMPGSLVRVDNALSAFRLERLFLGRHKFQHYRIWYRRQLAGYLQQVLSQPSSAVRGFFVEGALARMAQDHIRGVANYTVEIHRALTLELIARNLLDPS